MWLYVFSKEENMIFISLFDDLQFICMLLLLQEPIGIFTIALLDNKPAFVYELLKLGFAPADALFGRDSTTGLHYAKLFKKFYSETYLVC